MRTLHLKLMLILILLMLSIMTVVGTFLINSVGLYHLDEFSGQMSDLFSQNTEFVSSLRRAAASDNPVSEFVDIMRAFSGKLGVDGYNRNYYILDGKTGEYIEGSGSDEESGRLLDLTPNILTAVSGSPGYRQSITASFIDAAVPIGEHNEYIVYIRDAKQRSQELTTNLFMIIMQSLLFGFLISVLLSFLLSKTMTTPIENLIESAGALARGEFTNRPKSQSSDEIGVLTQTFNEMADALQNTLETVENERNKLETLFLHMTDGVCAFDRAGGIIQINPAAERLLSGAGNDAGYTELFGGLLEWEKAARLRPPEFFTGEMPWGNKVFTVYITPFGEGEPGVMAVIHDITEQNKLENIRREFVANVSHELRTPLTSVKSYSETLYENDDIDRETEKNFLGVIMSETDRMTRIVSDLLTLSHFDAGKTSMDMKPEQPVRVIESVYEAMYLEAKAHNHEMTLELSGSLPEIICDRDRLNQVFVNIVSNAVKYTPDGGKIEIIAGTETRDRKQYVFIKVKDTGIGIPKDAQSRLFERFYRVDKARSRAAGGSGLGLSIAQDIIRAHKGSIEIESEQGKGTTVTILLPVKRIN